MSTRRPRLEPYLFTAPFVVLFLVFSAWPLMRSLWLSFYATNGPHDMVPVGLANYRTLWGDPDFRIALGNNLKFAFWSVVLQIPLALGLALLLSQRWVRGRNFLRLAFFSPLLPGSVFVGVLFSILFIPQYGLLNQLLHRVWSGFPLDTNWLGNPRLVMPALVLTALWMYTGHHMMYLLAALQGVDRDLYDAARVDGAGAGQQLVTVTLPALRPVLIYLLLLSTIGSLQLFELPFLMLGNTAGPNKTGLTMVMYLYQNGFVTGDLGYAAAIGWTLACAVLLISLLQLRLTGALRGAP